MSDPCGWSITKCGCGSCWDTYTPTVQETAADLAIGVMWMATARQYGQCVVTVQPCYRPALLRSYQTYPVANPDYGSAYIQSGNWYNSCNGGEGTCCTGCEVELAGPTTTAGITSVTLAGAVLDPSAYEIHDGYLLVRTDGECWPTCVNHSSQTPAEFEVEYLRGIPIPTRVQRATERLACEFARACVGGACALPANLRTLTRQGAEYTVEELSTEPGAIRTGVRKVDLIIALENPYGRAQTSICLTPDMPSPRVIA